MSMSPKTRARVATARPELSRKIRASVPVSRTGLAPGAGLSWEAGLMVSALPGQFLQRADLHRAGAGFRATRGDLHRRVQVGRVDHPEAADLLLALGERAA